MKSYCRRCKSDTNHTKLYTKEEHKEYSSVDGEIVEVKSDGEVWQHNTYMLLECNGCDTITYRIDYAFSEDIDRSGSPIIDTSYYPNITKFSLDCTLSKYIPTDIKKIYYETIDNYNNENYILCTAGIRATLEAITLAQNIIIKDKNGKIIKQPNLHKKLINMKDNEVLSKRHYDSLNRLKILGNKALHEIKQPSGEELRNAIKIIEHTLFNLYELN